MPVLSPTADTLTVHEWKKKEGDHFKPSDVLAEVETDKAILPLEATEEGYLAKILALPGKPVRIGGPLATIVYSPSHVKLLQDTPTRPLRPRASPQKKEDPQ
uniref:Lipoyl-binding domain-containing protein n=1 Tax=Arcella intermedia TaxID=1963864 RepID=A0A6B2LT50_9EUKA